MTAQLTDRLNQILPRITGQDFLSSQGIGNEIACYIFDYAPADELKVRAHIALMLDHMASHHAELKVLHLDLFDVILDYLRSRKLLDKVLQMETQKGSAAVLSALRGPLAAERIRDFIRDQHNPAASDLLLVSGVGSAWPMLRAHGLLNCLHTIMAQTPLVMFYPGSFDGTTLRLFGRIDSATAKPGTKPYYRAFILVPGGART